jgi:hypothetical protein
VKSSHCVRVYFPDEQRPDALPLLNSPVEFDLAVRRGDGIWTDDDQERVGGVDRADEVGLIVRRPVGDAPVDVDGLSSFGECGADALDESGVLARVTDERVERFGC